MRRAFAARNAKLGDPDFVKNPVERAALHGVGRRAARDHQARNAPRRRSEIGRRAGLRRRGPAHDPLLGGRRAGQRRRAHHHRQPLVRQRRHGEGRRLPPQQRDGRLRRRCRARPTASASCRASRTDRAGQAHALVDDADDRDRHRTARWCWSLGAAGGPTIITAVFQILSNVVDFGLRRGDAR